MTKAEPKKNQIIEIFRCHHPHIKQLTIKDNEIY
jgi:hypothetical protein